MRFLDLDLDAFLDDVKHNAQPNGPRLDDEEFAVWSEGRLREFLENQCGLSTANPIQGWFVEHHDAAFDIMNDLIQGGSGALEVVHVDAHADLGLGDGSWTDLIRCVGAPLRDRRNPKRGSKGLNLGSWLAYALTAEFISDLVYVYPKGWGNDLHSLYLKDCDRSSGMIEMKAFTRPGLPMMGSSPDYQKLLETKPDLSLPPVPFRMITLDAYSATGHFDFGLLCNSPNYTPPAADRLIPVIGEYIRFGPDDAA